MMSEEYDKLPGKFWNEWMDSDTESRIKMLSQTMLARELTEHFKQKFRKTQVEESYVEDFSVRVFNDYLEDLLATVNEK